MSFSSMYVGATGVIAHGDRMQVVANNLANVSTVGYKKADALFSDLMSKQAATTGGQYQGGACFNSQIGTGVAVAEIRNIFQEGGLQNTNTNTDIAITGQGFFGTRNTHQSGSAGATHYTRAGAFRFNNEAYMVDPHDFRLQGYEVDRETGQIATNLSDIQLPYEDTIIDGQEVRVVRSEPKATSSVEMLVTLDAKASDQYQSYSNPFFALLEGYDGTLESGKPFGAALPAYSSSLNVYDSEGNDHDLTVYFDPVPASAMSNATPGYSYWEYVVALPADADGSGAYGTSSAGLAGIGVMAFNGNGQIAEHSAYSVGAGGTKNLSSWEPASFSSAGHPQFQFTFGSNGSAVGSMESVELNFGLSSTSSSWVAGGGNADTIGRNAGNLLEMADLDRDLRSSTSFDSGSATLFEEQDGFASGYLQSLSINREGAIEGNFSNGQTEELYVIAMYRFNSDWGLRRAGNNNFVATEASGAAVAGRAEVNGRGTFQQNTLERSNVDMAEEFANMILTQRGYQANTKVITTSDTLLNTTINIKR
ncbi:flagellar hook protein FlgE [uncultured Pseudodesulfovibrio sp.]|uniref:flagellar hook protein FlgE n=1 Tax=uncultured Pseudodesulfovibrio sp. TaxID=2035858 RepID=UPI0029C6CAF1|nr:flagellar hook protein FlgE [uncultured Pseudodesulfovibrio sp.]